MNKKKIGLTGAILMGIGGIVGSGIFGTMPSVAAQYGAGIVLALLLAALRTILNSIQTMYMSSAIPVSASGFMWSAKIVHPYAGMFSAMSSILMPTMVALFGILFATYFKALFPSLNISSTAAAVGLLLVFTVIAWFGNKTTVSASNLMVIVLMISIALYIILGLPRIDSANITFGQIIRPGIGLSGLGAAVGLLSSSLAGASTVSQLADDMENPRRNIPLALALCPLIVSVIYIFMAVVTIGVVPYAEVTSLSQVASNFMSPALLTFFIVGGPIFGIITSLVPVALACVAMFDFAARTKVFPAFFSKKNKYGIAYYSLFTVMAIAILICSSGASFGVVMTIFSVVNTVSGLPGAIAPILAHKKYPKTFEQKGMKIPFIIIALLTVGLFVVNVYLAIQMLATLESSVIAKLLAVVAAGFVYIICRLFYLKKNGIDLVKEMAEPYAPWEEMEKSLS